MEVHAFNSNTWETEPGRSLMSSNSSGPPSEF